MICRACYRAGRHLGDTHSRALLTAWRCTRRDLAAIRRNLATRAALARLNRQARP